MIKDNRKGNYCVHVAQTFCPRGTHFKDTYDKNKSNRYTSIRLLNGYCMKNDYGCKDFDGEKGSCKKCEDGYDRKKNKVSGNYCVMGWNMIWYIVAAVAGGLLIISIFCCVCAAC
jgi:hypothetical protein